VLYISLNAIRHIIYALTRSASGNLKNDRDAPPKLGIILLPLESRQNKLNFHVKKSKLSQWEPFHFFVAKTDLAPKIAAQIPCDTHSFSK
jgi:hypothetical protein